MALAAVFTMSCNVRVRTFPTKRKMTTSPDSDSHKLSLKIIEAVREHPVLYRPSEVRSSTVKLQELRQKVWNKIADDLGVDANWMRLRWKNLRDTYSRILKNLQRADRGERRKKWIFEDDLSFLKFQYEPGDRHQIIQVSQDYIETINSSGNTTKRLLKQLEDKNDENYTEYLDVVDPSPLKSLNVNFVNPSSSYSQVSSWSLCEKDKSNKIEDTTEIMVNILPEEMQPSETTKFHENYNCERDRRQLDGETMELPTGYYVRSYQNTESKPFAEDNKSLQLFFDGMKETVKRLPATVQADVKMKIFQIVNEAEIKYSNGSIRNSSEKYIHPPPGGIPNLVLIPCNRIDEQKN
ncbi:transcription factor Adf-1-like [Ceratina calcarata]|uniref:Transcription factor Adf-1-like n=1 Tax=Ceratina calcarata TaxID=156304 RepID=A0AAJ7JAL9_9HYME|nr:transcription factor Adf-1-like [Ceratina calcarata]